MEKISSYFFLQLVMQWGGHFVLWSNEVNAFIFASWSRTLIGDFLKFQKLFIEKNWHILNSTWDRIISSSLLGQPSFSNLMYHCHGWETAGCSRHAGQSNFPRIVCRQNRLAWKNCVVLLPKKRRRPVSFRHKEKRFSLWTAPWLSIKSGVYRSYAIFRLPSLIILWPLH